MKVLFAVNNENISESIIKKYQQDYKEIISAKNVYYFNAIIKELQKDKTYDRIIISEDLQPFSNNNYDAIDKFIFEKMDNISDEATNQSGNDIPIILICTDRREKSDPLLVKLFGIGVYNALFGKDRSITKVCELLEKPRTKKEAKVYYRIDSDDVDYKVENEGDVSEVEIQNILNHYKKINGNEEKYVESFDHIASQYTEPQLRLIAKFLPLNVKAVLEANSQKYQEIVSFGMPSSKGQIYKAPSFNNKNSKFAKQKNNENSDNSGIELVEKNLTRNKMTEPVIIPSAINTARVRKMDEVLPKESATAQNNVAPEQSQEIDDILGSLPTTTQINTPEIDTAQTQYNQYENSKESEPEVEPEPEPKRRGRPKKIVIEETKVPEEQPKKGRGRPKKQVEENTSVAVEPEHIAEPTELKSQAPVNLFELGDEDTDSKQATTPNVAPSKSGMILPGLENDELFEENEMLIQTMQEQDDGIIGSAAPANFSKPKPAINAKKENPVKNIKAQEPIKNIEPEEPAPSIEEPIIQDIEPEESLSQIPPIPNIKQETANLNSIQTTSSYNSTITNGLMSQNKKLVAFVGTSKNGTSFLVNNIAEVLSQKGINTAILDLTKNKNAYYIYTENEENLRKTAYSCIENLKQGNATGIAVHKNLTVYTTLPGEDEQTEDYSQILQTLMKNYSLVILDCDFETNYNYFKEAQELYLVQSLDVLTIQPLTAFLRDLKAKNVLYPEKIRIVLNKVVKLRSISEKTIIGGMAYYNDPAMSFMTELFNKDTVKYTTIQFEEQAYAKYLEALINCKITLNGYSKNFLLELNKLGDMVYPLINNTKNKYSNYSNYQTQNNFSNNMNNTLNKMKNNY